MLGMTQKKFQDGVFFGSGYSTIKNLLFFVILLLTVIAVFVPFSPSMPSESLDPSWVYGMNQALAQGMAFGKDIIFTFGPYASIYTKAYHPATDQLMIFGALYLAIFFFLAAYLNFNKAGRVSQVALLITLSMAIYTVDALFFFYPLLVGLQVYQWARSFDAKKPDGIAATLLLASLFTPLGLLPLIKGSTLIACVAITLLSVLLLIKRKRWLLCVLVGLAPVSAMSIFWVLAGQSLIGLPEYFFGLWPIINGYTEAMAVNGSSREIYFYIVATAFLIGVLLHDTKGTIYDKSLVALMFLCILFLAFKAGFVRHDGHALNAGAMILMAAILAGTLTTNRSTLIVLIIALATWGYIFSDYTKISPYYFLNNFKTTYSNAWFGMTQRLLDPLMLKNSFGSHNLKLKTLSGIPKLDGTVDIYSYEQSYLIASGNKWNPRPTFQSYSAYTTTLAEKNKAHLLGKHRPDNILFKVQPIDGRLPSLEDGASWPVLLTHYEPTSMSNGYLYLKHRNTGKNSIQSSNISRRAYSLGEQIDLPNSDGLIFIKINLKKSLAGEILNVLFKPSGFKIKLILENGARLSYTMIANMAASGFIISPLVENTDEFSLLFAGANHIVNKKVKSIEIVANPFSFLWKNDFEIEFSSFDYKATPSFIDKLGFSQPNSGLYKGFKRVLINDVDSILF